ncbi:MAG TPA: lysophospholipid acyltransferase family protein [Gemmatimonadales bacterium]|nr:lysophospholipid acyltransferase family protein [Gemmatimonadales bacterium]
MSHLWPAIASIWTWTMLALLFLAALPLLVLARLLLSPFDRGHYIAGRIFRMAGATAGRVNPLWHFSWSGPVPPDMRRPYVVVSNHESTADIMLVSQLPWEMKWLSKREMFKIPVMGWLMWLAGDIGVRRGSARSAVEAMRECRDRLEKRVSVMIFPEGTRSTKAELLPFKDGAFRLAVDTQLPILPLALAGTRDALPRRGFVMNRATAHVRILEPVETAGMTTADVPALRDRVRDIIDAARRQLKQ